jgi:chromosome segregation ATPase
MPSSDKAIDLRFYEESHIKLEEAQNKLRETEAKLNEAVCAQKEYKERFIASDKQVIELKEKYMISEKKVNELEQKCSLSEQKISELEQSCIQLEQKCRESDRKAVNLEDKWRESESRIKILEDALQSTVNIQTKSNQFEDLEERLIKLTNELSDNRFFLDDTREQLKRTEKELHASQKKCREFQIYATKYNDAMKTIEELRSFEASFGNRIEMRDEAIEKFDEERAALLSRIHFLEEGAKKNDAESLILREQLRRLELLNKELKQEIDREQKRAKEQFMNSSQEIRFCHKKRESEPIKECEMTDDRPMMTITETINLYDKKSKKYTKSLFIKVNNNYCLY